MKQILVLGANGKVGRIVVQLLLEKSYEVIAFVHNDDGSLDNKHVRVVEGDVHDSASVQSAVAGADAVISTLGSWGTPQKDIVSSGIKAVIPGMQKEGVKRIISLTGSDARAKGDHLSPLHRVMYLGILIGAKKILRDGEDSIAQLEKSGLEWTVIRSPIMAETGSSSYLLTAMRCLPWQTIHRHAVARSLVDQLDDKGFIGSSPFINR